MVIRTEYPILMNGVKLIASMFNAKNIKEDMKNIVFWCKGNEVQVVGYSTQTVCKHRLDNTTVEYGADDGDEVFVAFKVKDLSEILGAYSSIKKTFVSEVCISVDNVKGYEVILNEKAVDTEDKYADKYNKTARFKIMRVAMPESRKSEIVARLADDSNDNWENLNVNEANLYINTLLPAVGNEEMGLTSFINKLNFKDNKAYVIPLTHGIVMNSVVKPFDNTLFTSSLMQFIKGLIDVDTDTTPVMITRQEDEDICLLKIKVGGTLASIKTYNGNKCFILKDVTIPDNGVMIDKDYMIDVIRRMALTKDDVKFKINPADETFNVTSNAMTQDIPVIRAKGEGEFEFSLSPQIMSSMLLAHIKGLSNSVYIYLEKNDKGKINMVVTDSTKVAETGERLWYSYIENLGVKGVLTKWE